MLVKKVIQSRLLNGKETAAFCNWSMTTFYRKRKAGLLPAPVKDSPHSRPQWDVRDLEDYIQKNKHAPGKDTVIRRKPKA